jgi:hypothetical protein
VAQIITSVAPSSLRSGTTIGGIVGTVTAGERVNSTGPQVAGLFFVPAKLRERRSVIFCGAQSHSVHSFMIEARTFMARSGCFP